VIYEYKAKLTRVVDGDTLYMAVQLGFHVSMEVEFRLFGLNTPEVIGVQKTAGLAAKAELVRLMGLGSTRVVSEKSDKYGRWLGTFYVKQANGDELNVNEELLKGGFAKPYFGEGPKPV
jgi:micrococcal nuclease